MCPIQQPVNRSTADVRTKKFRNICAPTELMEMVENPEFQSDSIEPGALWSSTTPECSMHAIPSSAARWLQGCYADRDGLPPLKLWNKKSPWTRPNKIGPELMKATRFFHQ